MTFARTGKFNARRTEVDAAALTQWLQIGEFYIGKRGDSYWIEHESGEGMQTGKAFEKAIAEFYKENF